MRMTVADLRAMEFPKKGTDNAGRNAVWQFASAGQILELFDAAFTAWFQARPECVYAGVQLGRGSGSRLGDC
jgi:hypothetical protein